MDEIRFEFDSRQDSPYLHDELEILYVLSGSVNVSLTGSKYLLSQEDFIVFNPFEFHEVYPQPGSHTISAFFPLALLQRCQLGDVSCCSAIQHEQAAYHALIRSKLAVIFQDYMESPEQRHLYILSGIWGVLAVLKQQFEGKDRREKGHWTSRERVRAAILYIGTHFKEDITLEEVAKNNYISPGHLSRKFEQVVGIHFSDYLRNLRLHWAARYLRYSDKSVTEISELCGFHNVNTMITNFRESYGLTPGAYRRNHEGEADAAGQLADTDAVHFVNLLKHALDGGMLQPLNKQVQEPLDVNADIRTPLGKLELQHNYSMTFGYAQSYFLPGIPDAIRRSVNEVGFQYIFTQGIFDDGMGVYRERVDGTPWFDFTYLDIVLDFILSLGTKPWLELSRTPEKLVTAAKEAYFGGYVQLPSDLNKWSMLVDAFIRHTIDRYGLKQVGSWRFSLFPPFYISYGIFTLEEYQDYYYATWSAIRKRLPEATIISGAFDVGLLHLNGAAHLKAFLDYCMKKSCLPDEVGFQGFSIDYSGQSREEVEERIRRDISESFAEPAPPSADPDILRHDVERIRGILSDLRLESLPICFVYWNSTIWDSDLGNDTCYKSAYLVKNVVENAGTIRALNYSHSLIDSSGSGASVFAGKHGAMTDQGIPKAVYHAVCLLSHMGDTLIARGNGYVVSTSKSGTEIQILLYHYCHYNLDVHLDKFLPRSEQLTIDRYFGFEDTGVKSIRVYLDGIQAGEYSKETYVINREQGSSYDIWRKIGAPKELSPKQRAYLEHMSEPGYRYELMHVADHEQALISSVLDAHEVQLICLKKTTD